mgnify:CR=1 FL=1
MPFREKQKLVPVVGIVAYTHCLHQIDNIPNGLFKNEEKFAPRSFGW